MQRISQVWPGWQVDELIGQGGFGKVYRVSNAAGSMAAVKVIDIPRDESEVAALRSMGMDAVSIRSYFEDTARRVVDEVTTMEQLKGSPHVVHIEDHHMMERADGVGWTVLIRMELLEALDARLQGRGLPSPREAAQIGIDVSDALATCHDAGIIHRDVKPANVFRAADGTYKLGDFGIAKRLADATRTTKTFAGTGSFMAPEVPGGHYDHTVDVYSLGVMLYRWLNGGRPPFLCADGPVTQGDVERARVLRLTGERPPLPAGDGVPVELARIVRKACEPRPEDRWSTAEKFGRALRAWLDGETVDVPEGEVATPLGEPAASSYSPLDALADVGGQAAASGREPDAGRVAVGAAAAAVAAAAARRADAEQVSPAGDAPRRGKNIGITITVTAREALEGSARDVAYVVPSTGERRIVHLEIPAGTKDGAKLRCRGVGEPGADLGPSGDLLVYVRVAEEKGEGKSVPPVQPQVAAKPAARARWKPERPLWKTVLLALAVLFGFFMLALFLFIMFGPIVSAVVTVAAAIWYLVSVFGSSQ